MHPEWVRRPSIEVLFRERARLCNTSAGHRTDRIRQLETNNLAFTRCQLPVGKAPHTLVHRPHVI